MYYPPRGDTGFRQPFKMYLHLKDVISLLGFLGREELCAGRRGKGAEHREQG